MEIFLTEFEDNYFGYDIKINNENVTLGEYVKALNEFQEKTMAECRGCDCCCYERIPLTVADFVLAKPLTAKICRKAEEDVTVTDWLMSVAEINVEGGAIDVVLKRNADFSCCFLNKNLGECSEHLYRSLVCRTHCCLPKSQIAIDIRGDIINAGEDELCRRLLNTPDNPFGGLLAECNIEDYAENGFSEYNPEDWEKIPLKSIITAENWQILLSHGK